MTEAEEFNKGQAELFEMVDNADIEFMYEKEEFEAWLEKAESKRGKKRTLRSIYSTAKSCQTVFVGMGNYLSTNNLRLYKKEMQDNEKSPNTINRALSSINTYTTYLAEKYNNPYIKALKVKSCDVQPKQYIENIISRADYDFMCEEAKKNFKNPNIYLGIRIMGTTGVRTCELFQVKVEHIKHGYIDVIGKGAKRRRVYFPKKAREEILEYLSKLDDADSGYVMRYWNSKRGEQSGAYEKNTRDLGDIRNTLIFQRSFQSAIKRFGLKLGLAEEDLHAHGFRHFFAKEFLKHRLDITLLADLLGHSSLDITRIYLKMTSKEQAATVDETVTW